MATTTERLIARNHITHCLANAREYGTHVRVLGFEMHNGPISNTVIETVLCEMLAQGTVEEHFDGHGTYYVEGR